MIPILVEFFHNLHYSKQVISPELLNAHAHDAKHVLLFER